MDAEMLRLIVESLLTLGVSWLVKEKVVQKRKARLSDLMPAKPRGKK